MAYTKDLWKVILIILVPVNMIQLTTEQWLSVVTTHNLHSDTKSRRSSNAFSPSRRMFPRLSVVFRSSQWVTKSRRSSNAFSPSRRMFPRLSVVFRLSQRVICKEYWLTFIRVAFFDTHCLYVHILYCGEYESKKHLNQCISYSYSVCKWEENFTDWELRWTLSKADTLGTKFSVRLSEVSALERAE